ncbi:hypothetical protein SAMN05444000_12447 [Shimia gijangensis]|uniref:Uncharacterized protein n=1 Tax=Shimia gijangensis TaxID=1470563 RepID=A0A1M6R8T0_9RHOB|nr:hypothetical protein [Shimia gijangensis]SHK28873.1 hypothetical protein SAMN05444000_12447 [Shimia gijangensis]
MRLLSSLLCIASLPVLADCPTPGDMTRGVRLTEANGDTETFFEFSNRVVRGVYNDGTDSGSRYLLQDGIFVIEAFDTLDDHAIPGSRTTFLYPEDAPSKFEDTRWDVQVISLIQGEFLNNNESHIFGPKTQVEIGACLFDMVPVISIYHDLDGYEEQLNYLVDFGFAYLVEMKERDMLPDRFDYIRIEAINR